MNKKGVVAVGQICIMLISIIGFSSMVSSTDVWVDAGGKILKVSESEAERAGLPTYGSFADAAFASTIKSPSNTPNPVTPSGYQKAIDWIFDEGTAAPKGYVWDADTEKYISAGKGVGGASGWGYSASGIIQGAVWAVGIYGFIKLVGGMVTEDEAKVNAIAGGVAGGYFAGNTLYSLIGEGGVFYDSRGWWGQHASGVSLGVGIVVAAIIFYMTYKDSETETFTFECHPWDAPTGGANCEDCNEGILPCSEYQCRSLGQACQVVNPGSEESKCVWVNPKDVKFPIITEWDDALTEGYRYDPDNTISPPDAGVKVVKKGSTDGCVSAFERLSFGILLNEPAKCKVDYLRKATFDDMTYFFGGNSLLRYNHTQLMSLPGPNSEDNLTLRNDGNFELFVRCQDANGNYNTANFVFKYCVEKGPDTTPPLIVTTNLLNGVPVATNKTEVNLEVYINEPSECKWSHLNQDYDDMEEQMSCATSVFEMNAQMLYKCETTLTGIKNMQDNLFYFRCKDQPTKSEADRNTNAESYAFKVVGTQPLLIDEVGPNETVRDSTDLVKTTLTAETSAGYNEGVSTCYYSVTGEEGDYIKFFKTDSYAHTQELYLEEGDYDYYIKCIDLGGNTDVKTTYFEVESDSEPPQIVRTYHEENNLKLVTDEDSECVYDTVNCNYLFDDGITISGIEKDHSLGWNTETTLYVKCRDEYGNQPGPSECNIVIRAFDMKFD